MATFGNPYPGTYTPAWWFQNAWTTTTATTLDINTQTLNQHKPKVAAPPRPKTAVEWLRGRVQEMCDLAGLADA